MRFRRLVLLFLVPLLVPLGCTGGSAGDSSGNSADPSPKEVHRQADGARQQAGSTELATLTRYEGYSSAVYRDPKNWLCLPDTDDVCDGGLDSTRVEPDGTLTVQHWKADPDAPIDCFYVYPTVSMDPGRFSDRSASPDQEGFVALNQVARLGQECRVFAPIYRQGTLTALAGSLSGKGNDATTEKDNAEDPDTAYNDVVDAWKSYMANDNHGRGVVLVGHSQGAALLNRLIQAEVDPNPDVTDVLVSAYLAGWSVKVPKGASVGGDFMNIRLCNDPAQVHCVVTWSSYRSTVPPVPGAIFGRSSTDPRDGSDLVSACVNPASVGGGSAEAKSYFPTSAASSPLGTIGLSVTTDPATPDATGSGEAVTTPFVSTPGLVSVACRSTDGFNFLELTVHGDPADPRIDDIGGDLTPQWGMHLQDVNVVMGNIVDLVAQQSKAFAAAR